MAEHITRNDGGAGCRYGNKNRIGQTSIFIVYAAVAQSVEQLIRNQQVAGSNPASSSKTRRNLKIPAGFFWFKCTWHVRMYVKSVHIHHHLQQPGVQPAAKVMAKEKPVYEGPSHRPRPDLWEIRRRLQPAGPPGAPRAGREKEMSDPLGRAGEGIKQELFNDYH